MTAAPEKDPFEECLDVDPWRGESERQHRRLARREIEEPDAPTDIEGRRPWVADQALRRSGAEETERQAVHLGITAPRVVALSNAGPELVRRKGEGADVLDMVD